MADAPNVGSLAPAARALELADEAMARLDVDAVVAHLSAAIRQLTADGDERAAAMVCVRLGNVYANALGNLTAGRAWFARARRLVDEQPPCVEQGWVAVAAMGCDVDDPAELLAAAELALDRARRFGDVNLETKALADAGLAHVQAGRVAEGMALLDEAMALACGPVDDADTAGRSVCSFFTACYHAADFERAGSWADAAAPPRRDLAGSRATRLPVEPLRQRARDAAGRARPVDARPRPCSTRAKAEFEQAMPMPSWHPDIALADLRIRQGRLAEAEALLLGKDQAMQALLPAARLHLARGDHRLAAAVARRGLRVLGDDRLRAIELLTVLVDAELAAGDVDAADERRATSSTARTRGLAVPTLQARAAAATARVQAASGALDDAVATLEATLDGLDGAAVPWLRATLLVDLARLHEQAGDDAAARTHGAHRGRRRSPSSTSCSAPDDAALLATPRRRRRVDAPSPTATAVLRGDGKWWTATSTPTSASACPTRKGLRYLGQLLAQPGVERHALDLVDVVEGVDRGGVDRRALGDAGPLLDAAARAAYRRRIEELRADIDDALAAELLDDRRGAARTSSTSSSRQLAAAFGLGGRARRAGVGRRAGPPQRDAGPADGHRPGARRAARRRGGARPPGADGPVLRLRAGRRRSGALVVQSGVNGTGRR